MYFKAIEILYKILDIVAFYICILTKQNYTNFNMQKISVDVLFKTVVYPFLIF